MKLFTWRDAFFTVLLTLGIVPLFWYFAAGIACLPRLVASPDSQWVISQWARTLAGFTGCSTENATHIMFMGTAGFWVIVYSLLGGKKWMRQRNWDTLRNNRRLRREFWSLMKSRKSQQPPA